MADMDVLRESFNSNVKWIKKFVMYVKHPLCTYVITIETKTYFSEYIDKDLYLSWYQNPDMTNQSPESYTTVVCYIRCY